MTLLLREGELEFDFSAAKAAERVDAKGVPLPTGLKLTDFLVTEKSRMLMVEVKDPSDSAADPKRRQEFVAKLKGKELIHENLVPKARGTYTVLHLMNRARRPRVFVVVLGLEMTSFDPALLGPFKDRLLGRLRQEMAEPWKREYVKDCVVVTPDKWRKLFPRYPLRRRAD